MPLVERILVVMALAILVGCACLGVAASAGKTPQTANATATSVPAAQAPTATSTPIPQSQSPQPSPSPAIPTPIAGTGIANPTPKTLIPGLPVQFTCAEGVDYSYAKVCVHTLPGAQLYIQAVYCTGNADTSASLRGPKAADRNGNFEWDWVPTTTCKGNVRVNVVGSLGDFFGNAQTNFLLG